MDQEFKIMCEQWERTQKESNIRQILEKNKKKAQQTIQQFHRFELMIQFIENQLNPKEIDLGKKNFFIQVSFSQQRIL